MKNWKWYKWVAFGILAVVILIAIVTKVGYGW